MIDQAKSTYSLEKTFDKQAKTTDDQGSKQVEVLKVLKTDEQQQKHQHENAFPKGLHNVIKSEWYKIETKEENIDWKSLINGTNKYTITFQQMETLRSFGKCILVVVKLH